MSRPPDSAMRDVYGGSLMPVVGQVDVHVAAGVSLFAGIRWMGSNGRTVVAGTPIADEEYATSLKLLSYRFGLLASTRVASRWSIAGGGGVAITGYEETWPEAGLAVSDQSTGFVLLGEARYKVTSRWSATGRIEYTSVAAKTAVTKSDVNLGGVDVLGGLRFSF